MQRTNQETRQPAPGTQFQRGRKQGTHLDVGAATVTPPPVATPAPDATRETDSPVTTDAAIEGVLTHALRRIENIIRRSNENQLILEGNVQVEDRFYKVQVTPIDPPAKTDDTEDGLTASQQAELSPAAQAAVASLPADQQAAAKAEVQSHQSSGGAPQTGKSPETALRELSPAASADNASSTSDTVEEAPEVEVSPPAPEKASAPAASAQNPPIEHERKA